MSLTSKLALSVVADLSQAAGLATGRVPLNRIYQASLDNGTGAGKADLVYHAQRTLAPSATEDLDLAGVLASLLPGSALTFVRVKGLIVAARGVTDANGTVITPNVNNVVVGAAAGSPWTALLNSTGTVTLRPGAVFAAFADATDATAYAVTATTADLLKVANSAGVSSVTYDIIVIGASA